MAFTYPSSGGGATNLDGLTDVVLGTTLNGDTLQYDGTNWTESDSRKIIVPAANPLGWYQPKGFNKETFSWFDPNNCLGYDIMFDKGMWFTDISVLTKNYPVSGWAGGAFRVWLFNADATTGLPTTINKELGVITVPATNPAPMPFMQALLTTTITGGVYLAPNTRYWVVTSNGTGPVEGTYSSGPGPEYFLARGGDNSFASNYAITSDTEFLFGGANEGLFFGTVQSAGGINLTTPPANAGTIYTELNPTDRIPLVLLKGSID